MGTQWAKLSELSGQGNCARCSGGAIGAGKVNTPHKELFDELLVELT